MKGAVLKCVGVALACVTLAGCPTTRTYKDLYFVNESNYKIKTLVNLDYPDSSLERANPDSYLELNDAVYVGTFYDLREYGGVTVFIFEFGYFSRVWASTGGTSAKNLDEDSLLARYSLSKAELDSIGWRLSFP